jgi:uncharacterized membrane protein
MSGSRSGTHKNTHRRESSDLPMLAVAIAGMALTAYLTWAGGAQQALAFCDAGSGCDAVQSSRWSTLLSVPLSVWGFLAYAALALSAWRTRSMQRRWRAQTLIAFGGFSVSVYLTIVGILELDATCGWCLASLALWAVALALTWRPGLPAAPAWRLSSGGIALVTLLVLHLHYAGVFDPAAGPEDPHLRAVAEALTASGAKFYGASWCPHCMDQKKMFGAAGRFLPYVECAPNGPRAPQATECVAQQIKGYPTWVINGNRYQRMLSVRQLAAMGGVAAPAAE